MYVEIKPLNGTFIGYIKINNLRIYAYESTCLESNLEGLLKWMIVARKQNTICF